jgi:hypothetical protein
MDIKSLYRKYLSDRALVQMDRKYIGASTTSEELAHWSLVTLPDLLGFEDFKKKRSEVLKGLE